MSDNGAQFRGRKGGETKMRGIDYDEQPRRYAVTGRGLHVLNAEPVVL